MIALLNGFNPGDVILNGTLLLAIPMALLAGAVSFISPCVLPLVPGYLGFVSGISSNRARLMLGTVFFILGFSIVFASFGAIFGGLGGVVYASGLSWVQRILGVFVFLFGLVLVGKFEWLQRTVKFQARPGLGLAGALLLGVTFGLGWTPCIGPTLAAVLTLASQTGSPAKGAFLAFVYALGIGIPFLMIAAGFGWATRSMAFFKRHIRAFNIAGGSLLMLLGVLMTFGLWDVLTAWLQGEVFGYFQLTL
jgi:cytochrome c-type biogenesis protein